MMLLNWCCSLNILTLKNR